MLSNYETTVALYNYDENLNRFTLYDRHIDHSDIPEYFQIQKNENKKSISSEYIFYGAHSGLSGHPFRYYPDTF